MKDQNIDLLSRVIEDMDQYVFGKGCSITSTVPSQTIADWYRYLISIKADESISNRKKVNCAHPVYVHESGSRYKCKACNEVIILGRAQSDPVVNQVIDKLKERSRKGQEKYGRTLDEDPNSEDTLYWLNHFQEELLDACNYIQCLINNYESKG